MASSQRENLSTTREHLYNHEMEEVVQPDQYEHYQIGDVEQDTFQEDLRYGVEFYLADKVPNNESILQLISCSPTKGNDLQSTLL
ncbi:hypothetical protein AVEN_19715-1 [Araneus ventricosus]|uniref:Uncharacterized protein n=1 Tax=Araneus ventricosus TaxID=182803 RepID=A0A4Y2C2W9_ARAVE|nr:hypothetical protein AVEN_19715-1 [Araneus ventricosus]